MSKRFGKVDAKIINTGQMGVDFLALSADYTILDTDGYTNFYMTTSTTDRTVTLPTAADNSGRIITIKKVDSGDAGVILDGEGAETIDGSATQTGITSQYDFCTLQCDGTTWYIINKRFSTEDGLKHYDLNVVYRNGTPTLTSSATTGSGFTDSNIWFRPFKDASGDWFCEFNITITFDTSNQASGQTITFGGLTFDATAGFGAHVRNTSSTPIAGAGQAGAATSIVTLISTAGTRFWRIAGSTRITAKPTWAD